MSALQVYSHLTRQGFAVKRRPATWQNTAADAAQVHLAWAEHWLDSSAVAESILHAQAQTSIGEQTVARCRNLDSAMLGKQEESTSPTCQAFNVRRTVNGSKIGMLHLDERSVSKLGQDKPHECPRNRRRAKLHSLRPLKPGCAVVGAQAAGLRRHMQYDVFSSRSDGRLALRQPTHIVMVPLSCQALHTNLVQGQGAALTDQGDRAAGGVLALIAGGDVVYTQAMID